MGATSIDRESLASTVYRAGELTQSHNMAMGEITIDHAYCTDARPTDYFADPRTFMGIRRADGRPTLPICRVVGWRHQRRAVPSK
jgi:hypothetical protein